MFSLRIGFLVAVLIFGVDHSQSEHDHNMTSTAAPPTAQEEFANGASLFSTALYDILRRTDDNVFFSPLSLQVVLALANAGAAGNTAAQIREGAKLPSDLARINDGIKGLLDTLKSTDDITLELANGIFLQQDYDVKPEFLSTGEKYFSAAVKRVDFKDSEVARGAVNSWVEEKTKDKIKELLAKGTIDQNTRLVLLNAVYFKGNWADKFDANLTYKGPFYLSEKETKEVDFMKITKHFRIAENSDLKCTVIELPYKGNDISMVILLPNEKEGLKELEEKLTNVSLKEVTSRLYRREVILSLPKFKLEQTIDLKDILIELGMDDMFNASAADFTNINPGRELVVSKVVQKSFIEVNEEGSEAAAATGIKISMRMMPLPPLTITADRPFIFLIRSRKTAFNLFYGRLSNV